MPEYSEELGLAPDPNSNLAKLAKIRTLSTILGETLKKLKDIQTGHMSRKVTRRKETVIWKCEKRH